MVPLTKSLTLSNPYGIFFFKNFIGNTKRIINKTVMTTATISGLCGSNKKVWFQGIHKKMSVVRKIIIREPIVVGKSQSMILCCNFLYGPTSSY